MHSSQPNLTHIPAAALCTRCASLDIDAILSTPPKSRRGRLIMKLGDDKNLEISSCYFCRLLHQVSPKCSTESRLGDLVLYAFPLMDRLWISGDTTVVLGVLRLADTKSTNKTEESLQITGCISSTTPPRLGSGESGMKSRIIRSELVDYKLLKSWVQYCNTNHQRCSQKDPKPVAFFSLINCFTRQVERANASSNYVALSYSWGPDTQAHGSLETVCPKTIEDAITVTKALGFTHLWVDKYCVAQNDEKIRSTQIQQMNLVYSNAQLTLVAAAGAMVDCGLPGVSSVHRTGQPQARVGNHVLVSLMSDLRHTILNSWWNSRGWTLQEAIFSRRLLVFTQQQVYFECAATNLCESVDVIRDWSGWNIFNSDQERRGWPWIILERLEQYTKRELTYQHDILNAFYGVLDSYENSKYPVYHHWGVPILPPVIKGRNGWPVSAPRCPSDGFIAGLCWQQLAPGQRRSGFPSWSWAGWKVNLSKHSTEYERGLRRHASSNTAAVFLQDVDGHVVPLESFSKSPGKTHNLTSKVLLSAFSLPLKLIHDPLSKHTQPEYLPSSGRKPTKGSEYWANFPINHEVSLQARVYLLEREMSAARHKTLIETTFTGIVLGESQHLAENPDTFIMVTSDNGDDLERIGHIILGRGHVRIVDHISTVLEGYEPRGYIFKACFNDQKKRLLSLC